MQPLGSLGDNGTYNLLMKLAFVQNPDSPLTALVEA